LGKFNEKTQWLKLYERTPLHTLCADKYAVREYIKAVVGEQYLVPLLFYTENVDDLTPENLPDIPFIIKTTHDSSGSVIVTNKKEVDWQAIRKKMKKKLAFNFYYRSREWQYKHIKPAIVVEKLLEDNHGEVPEFSMHCFNGKVKLIRVYVDKDGAAIFYDLDWNVQPTFWLPKKKKPHREIERPKSIDKMIEIAERFASPFSYVRVDFYDIDGKIYCGEITFHHIAGFQPFKDEALNVKLGEMIRLPYENERITKDKK